jgi:hypothetical protein
MFHQAWMFTAITIIIITLTGMATAVLTVLSAMGELTFTNYGGKHFLSKRGKWVAFLALLILAFSLLQFVVSDEKEKFTTNQDYIEDSVSTQHTITEINKGVDTNSQRLFKNLSDALAKQGLKFDTLTSSLTYIKDSLKTIPTTLPEKPILLLRNNGISVKDSANDKLITVN